MTLPAIAIQPGESTSAINVVMLPVSDLSPNCWNPNRMPPEQYAALVDEVRRLRRPCKPIIARRVEHGHEIVDGEHTFRAAVEVGLTHVPCEVVEVDDFEARRQCLVRNEHGVHDRVVEGRLIEQMKKERGLSNRELATTLGRSEGSVRNALAYADAASLRNRYATDDERANTEIAGLSIRHVRMYLELPEILRDRWVDAGAGAVYGDWLVSAPEVMNAMEVLGIGKYIDGTPEKFNTSVSQIREYCRWWIKHEEIAGRDDYVRAVAALGLPVGILDQLPCRDESQGAVPIPSPNEWEGLLATAKERAVVVDDAPHILAALLEKYLDQHQIDPADYLDVVAARKWRSLVDSGRFDFIVDCEALHIREKLDLASLQIDDVSDELLTEAKRRTCERLAELRGGETPRDADEPTSTREVFASQLIQLHRTQFDEIDNSIFGDRTTLIFTVVENLLSTGELHESSVDDRPVSDIMVERLQRLEEPELCLLAGALLQGSETPPGRRWLAALTESDSSTVRIESESDES